MHGPVTRIRAALVVAAVAVAAAVAVSGGSSSDARTPPPLPGLPAPFLTTAVLGEGGLTAGIDSYGDVVDLRAPGPAGAALVSVPLARQQAGTVAASDAVVPRVSIGGGRARPLWEADTVRQGYLPGTNVLRTTARFGGGWATIECAAGGALGCVTSFRPAGHGEVRHLVTFRGGGISKRSAEIVETDDRRARQIIAGAIAADRRWLARARPLGAGAPDWARRLYARSLLVLHALTGSRGGEVAAGARDGWAYVWPRDAGAAALALAAAGYGGEARRIARFLHGLDLDAAARFEWGGDPVPGRAAQGDAWGWVAAAARAARLPRADWTSMERQARKSWRNRADYQEKSAGDYLGNALAARTPAARRFMHRMGAQSAARGLERVAGDSGSGLDSAAAWAVRPFPQPRLFTAARRTLSALESSQRRRFGPGATRFGLVPSETWPQADPWTAPTAWSAWSLAALAHLDSRPAQARRDRAGALRLMADLRRAETPAGVLPERVAARTGVPLSTAPLAWSHAFAILAIRQLWPGARRR